MFFAKDEDAAEIFQNTFVAFWENIEKRKIYEEDGIVKGKNNEPLSGSILTYFMGIARIKYLEWSREHPSYSDPETEMGRKVNEKEFDIQQYTNMLYDSSDNVMLDIIAEIISHMSPRCNEILTKFYYEQKDLDSIMLEIPSIESKDALKTKKYKCLETLRKKALEIYNKNLNS